MLKLPQDKHLKIEKRINVFEYALLFSASSFHVLSPSTVKVRV